MLLIGLVEAYYVLFPDWDKILTYAEILKETEDDEVDSDEYLTDSDDPDENTALLGA